MKIKSRIIWVVGTVVALCVCFFLSRYSFFHLHGMKDWPFDLFIFGLITIIIAAIFNSRIAMFCTPLGYIGGFIIGMLFNADGVDAGGARTNNAWIIWALFFLVIIAIGIIVDIIFKIQKPKIF